MHSMFRSELIVSVVLVLLLVFLWNPFGWYMTTSRSMIIAAAVIVVFAIFASFVWRERVRDEREGFHRLLANRIAYLLGTATLVLSLAVQTVSHTIDGWIVLALAVMIFGKVVGLIYGHTRH